MKVIQARNMHEVFPRALDMLLYDGLDDDTIIGCRDPVSLVIEHPKERLVYGNADDLNPFAMLFHALWIIGGCNDTSFLDKLFSGYNVGRSDDGITLHGAYGFRMREHFGAEGMGVHTIDQLKSAISMLKKDSHRRDVVIGLWDTCADLGLRSRNLPTATHLYLSIDPHGDLDMMVVYRETNIYDMQRDSVAFSLMQEVVAHSLKIPVGRMTITMNQMHCSTTDTGDFCVDLSGTDPYIEALSRDLVIEDSDKWLGELSMFLDEGPVMGMREPFLKGVVSPMWQAWRQYKGEPGNGPAGPRAALETVSHIRAADWCAASREWLKRRIHERTNAG